MLYVAPHTRERIVTAEVLKLERRQAAERARAATPDSGQANRAQRPDAAGRSAAGVPAAVPSGGNR